jgi:hypothetical protein
MVEAVPEAEEAVIEGAGVPCQDLEQTLQVALVQATPDIDQFVASCSSGTSRRR